MRQARFRPAVSALRWAAAICLLGATAGCVTQDQRISIACPMVGGDVFLNSRLCDGDMRVCDDRPYAHQNITVLNRTDSAVAVEIAFSDGSKERHVMTGGGQHLHWEKPVGTGVTVTAQC